MSTLTARAAAVSAIACTLLSTNVAAVNLATDGIGEVSIAPYYTTRDGWLTTIMLTNTRDVPIVVKVRFHEGRNSRDVLDFNVALSAFDVFTGVVRESASGNGPVFVATDSEDAAGRKTCTIPSFIADGVEVPLSPLAFGPPGTDNDDGGPVGVTPSGGNPTGTNAVAQDRMREGYIEFIVMGHTDEGENLDVLPPPGTLLGDIATAIESHDCATLDLAFDDEAPNDNILNTARQFGEPINALKFNFTLLNPERGVEAGNTATTWANFYKPAGNPVTGSPNPSFPLLPAIAPVANAACTVNRGAERNGSVWSPGGGGGSCMNLITAQTPFAFLEPSLNDAYPPVANWWDDRRNFPAYGRPFAQTDGAPGGRDVRGVDAFSLTIQRSAIINEWSNNPTLGVTTDWIVTLPTKGFYVDGGVDNPGPGQQSAVYQPGRPASVLDATLPYPPFAENFAQAFDGDRFSASSCNRVGLAIFDRAEQRTAEPPGGGVIPSPAPPPIVETVNLCYETNVITFNGQSALNSIYPLLDGDRAPTTVDTSSLLPNTTGWMMMQLDVEPDAAIVAIQTAPPFQQVVGAALGLPVVGVMIKQRNFGDPGKNFASSVDHGYLREFVQVFF